ncbi:MAG: stage II sporulation protein P, partial [Clostridia bacterium]|nr:stage II sporulation protein P [Clostridia bacterium]
VKTTGEPLVLIVHTHGTEGFAEEGKSYYNDSINYPRSEDVSKNIVAVGKVLCDVLNENGIPTIHCETMHDKESYISAYERTAESIKHYLEKYPSIQYVFDVHRDSLIRTDLTKLKPVTLYENEPCAQVMMIIGSNEKGATEYDWESNLVLAEAIQQNLFEDASGVARQLYLRGATYNQQYTKHGLLIEIGSCGNTLKEAKNAARAFGEAVVKVLKSE